MCSHGKGGNEKSTEMTLKAGKESTEQPDGPVTQIEFVEVPKKERKASHCILNVFFCVALAALSSIWINCSRFYTVIIFGCFFFVIL